MYPYYPPIVFYPAFCPCQLHIMGKGCRLADDQSCGSSCCQVVYIATAIVAAATIAVAQIEQYLVGAYGAFVVLIYILSRAMMDARLPVAGVSNGK